MKRLSGSRRARQAQIKAHPTPSLSGVPGVSFIPLGKGKIAIIDQSDYEFISQFKWHYHKGYAARGVRIGKEVRKVFMHRIINMTPEGFETDHINGNKLDNRKANLRGATPQLNARNRKSKSKTGYKGVYLNRRSGKYYAQVCLKTKRIHLGSFDTPEDAALAYNLAATKHFKEFARLNNVRS